MEQQVSLAGSRLLSAAVSAILAAGAAQAAEDPVIAEVTVTATRRVADIQDVPLNITAVGSADIQAQGITNLVDVSRTVPGLFVLDQGPRAANAIIVRGLNADPVTGTEALNNSGGGTVATYVGEIPLYVDLKLEDIERVEVLLGPQGTLYGAGTLGGAIRYIPRRPQLDRTSLELRADAFALSESDDIGSKSGFTFNTPFGDRLAFRMSLDYLDDPGFIDYGFLVIEGGVSDAEPDLTNPAAVAANLRRQEDVDFQKTWAGRAALLWQVTDSVDANLTYFYQDQDVGGRTLNHRSSFDTGRYETAARYLEPNSRKNELLALEVTADLGFAELTSATGYSEYREGGQRDQTDLLINLEYSYELFPSFSAYTREDERDRTINQEIRLVSAGDGPLNWIGGVFYNETHIDAVSSEFTPGYSEYLVGGTGEGFRPDALEYYAPSETDLKEKAVYGEISYDFSDAWQVTVGARYYEYDLESIGGADFPLILTASGDRAPNEVDPDLNPTAQSDSGSLFKINTSYDFSDDVMAYLTLSEGYRIGNSNGLTPCTGGETQQTVCGKPRELEFTPDKTKNYEIGVRTQWLNRSVTVNAAIFYIDWEDPQLATATEVGAVPITINGKGASTAGVELTFAAELSDRFSLRGSYSYVQAELTADAPDLVRAITPPAVPGECPCFAPSFITARDGDRLPGTPEHQGSIFATYRLDVVNGWQLDLNYGIAAISDVLTRTGELGGGEALPGFAVHSASAVLDAGSWTLALYGKNLFNKYAETGVRTTPDFNQTVFDENGDPVRSRSYSKDVLRTREIGLRFTYGFDL